MYRKIWIFAKKSLSLHHNLKGTITTYIFITMKIRLIEWMKKVSGALGDNYYASNAPNQPGWVIVKRKPGPHDEPGTRKERRWKMPENQAKGVQSFRHYQTIASAEYKDPEKRAQWEAEYAAWMRNQRKHGNVGNKLHGKVVRFLWDYIRICVRERENGGVVAG